MRSRPLAREVAGTIWSADEREGSASERFVVLEQKVSHMEEELDKMAAKVDEMHAILLQARGVRWAVITVSGLVAFLAGISHWLLSKA